MIITLCLVQELWRCISAYLIISLYLFCLGTLMQFSDIIYRRAIRLTLLCLLYEVYLKILKLTYRKVRLACFVFE